MLIEALSEDTARSDNNTRAIEEMLSDTYRHKRAVTLRCGG
jgi:hypothetical protein